MSPPKSHPGRNRREPLPRLVRFLMAYAAFGALVGCAVAGALLLLPNLPIGELMANTSTPVAAVYLYFGSFAATFASLAMGTAIMLLPKGDEPPPSATARLVTVPVRVRRGR